MATPLQQQSFQRKIIYIIAILVLFFVTYLLKESTSFGIDKQAADLKIQEESFGKVELTGSVVRLALTGSRGLAVCYLWYTAQDKMKKHSWNELELIVNSLTKLQPHFITPWLFQSWNLAYNVSVESDRIRDKYFYITRGIELLAEGERQNENHPDLRHTIGFYNQHKIGVADEATTLRCLFQMSCIDPRERDPLRLRKPGTREVDQEKFAEFCRNYPMLVRRLHDKRKLSKPEDIVDFLAENQKLPSRYEEPRDSDRAGSEGTKTPLKPYEHQFPVVAPIADAADPNRQEFENFMCSRDWYIYAIAPMPPPNPDLSIRPEYDRTKYRMPKAISANIFRGYPARGEAYMAENYQKEGWFDQEGWWIRGEGWFDDDKFPDTKANAIVGQGENWSVRAWSRAFEMYRDLGQSTGMYLTPQELQSLTEKAALYRRRMNVAPGEMGQDPPPERRTPEMEASQHAHLQLHFFDVHRRMTNFPHFLYQCEVEQDPKTVAVRKAFFQADQERAAGNRDDALNTLKGAMKGWREILLAHKEFRRDETNQEDAYEIELTYQDLVKDLYGAQLRELMVLTDYMSQRPMPAPGGAFYPPPAVISKEMPLAVLSPFSGTDDEGVPIISPDAVRSVRGRKNLPMYTSQDMRPPPESVAPPQ